MKPNELRIGNYHNYDTGEGIEVGVTDIQDLFWLSKNPNDEDYQPIPLTEEWLKKFGFHISRNQAHKVYNDLGNIFALNKVNKEFEFTWGAVQVRYVHQLQNLYWCLTGEELQIKKVVSV